MSKNKFISIIFICVAAFGLYIFFIKYFIFHKDRGQYVGQEYYDAIDINHSPKNSEQTTLYITHELPLVFLKEYNVVITNSNSIQTTVLYKGPIKEKIQIKDFPETGSLSFILYKNGYRFSFGSKGGFDLSDKTLKVVLFTNHNKDYMGWYKMER